MPQLIVQNLSHTVNYNPVISLLNNFHILNIPINSKCGGRGNCGTCKVKILEGGKFTIPINRDEKFRLTQEELDEGWRLSCQCYALKDLTIDIPEPEPT